MKIKEKIVKEGYFSRLLKKLASSNKKNFGNGRLDCCNIQEKNKK